MLANKSMQWKKLGVIFNISNDYNSLDVYSHAVNPVPLLLKDNIYRIFFSVRDSNGKSNVSFFDFDFETLEILYFDKYVSLNHGNSKLDIDESGISIGCLFDNSIYYMAWQNLENQHWRGDIAYADLLPDLKTFEKPQNQLFMGVDEEDKISLSYPFILSDYNVYHLWYGSTETWDYGNGEMLHVIKYAVSTDMKNWTKSGCCISPEIGVSQAFSRPCVIKVSEHDWHMWYSYRGNKDKYKIGYANSINGVDWNVFNNQQNVVYCSESGWDSEMVCYPYVFQHKDKLYMLYNGNGYGKTGIGLAVCEDF